MLITHSAMMIHSISLKDKLQSFMHMCYYNHKNYRDDIMLII
jgi:hypothetical protein